MWDGMHGQPGWWCASVATAHRGGLRLLRDRVVGGDDADGQGSGGVLVEPGGARAFMACGPDNSVAVVDLQSLKVIGHVDAGGEPDGMASAVRQ